ncbi:MAG: hypothetical protein JXR83_01675 [Deltaproteobacteria bacterium]|nr:hypothetical protein [Deltaproteobacteria bacterium]
MGHQYQYRFAIEDRRPLKLLICGLPHFAAYDPETREFEYRGPGNRASRQATPDLCIRIVEHGLEIDALGSGDVVHAIVCELETRLRGLVGEIRVVV